jgi:hypothetical protein
LHVTVGALQIQMLVVLLILLHINVHPLQGSSSNSVSTATTAEAIHTLYGTGIGSGNMFDAGGSWLAATKTKQQQQRKARTAIQTTAISATAATAGIGSTGNSSTTVVEGLRIPANLSSVRAVNIVLNQQAGKLNARDLKAAMMAASMQPGAEV